MNSFTVGCVPMQFPIILGAGDCKYPTQLERYFRDDVPLGALCLGSITPNNRSGNKGVLFYPDDLDSLIRKGFALNAFGMPNDGFEKTGRDIPLHPPKPVIVSIAGSQVGDFIRGKEVFGRQPNIAAIKFNLGCPNAHDCSPVPLAYDLRFLELLFRQCSQTAHDKPLWLKLSPYLTREELDELASNFPHIDFSATPTVTESFLGELMQLLASHSFIRAVVFSNTLGNVIVRGKDEQPVTTPNQGKAGLSGPIIKEISLRLIRRVHALLPNPHFDCIGSGSVLTGDDVVDYLEAEAKAVCTTSGPYWSGNGPRFAANLLLSERLQTYLLRSSS